MQSESLLGNDTIAAGPIQTTYMYTVMNLTPGTTYEFRVLPVNSLGDGPLTNAISRTGTMIDKQD